MSRKFEVGIFDFDGTICDSIPAWEEALRKTLKRRYQFINTYIEELLPAFHGADASVFFREILSENDLPCGDSVIDLILRGFIEAFSEEKVSLFSGAEEVFRKLKGKNVALYISSRSGKKRILKGLPPIDAEIFNAILGSESDKDKEHVQSIFKLSEMSADDFRAKTLFVGDTQSDMRIARSNGLFPIGIANTQSHELLFEAGACAVIDDLGEVLPFFGCD